MLSCNSNTAIPKSTSNTAPSKVIVKINVVAYDLSNSEQYADFLLWVTSYDNKKLIDGDAFKISGDIPEEYLAKVSMYMEFLVDYGQKRQNKLVEMAKTLTTE